MSVHLGAHDLARALRAVEHARAGEHARPILSCVLLTVADGHLYAVTADNYRMAECEIPVRLADQDPAELDGATIAPDGLPLLRAFLGLPARTVGSAAAVKVTRNARSLTCSWAQFSIDVPLMDGTYPPYRSAIPPKTVREWAINPAYLHDAAKAGEKLRLMSMSLRWNGQLQPVVLDGMFEGATYREIIMPVRTAETTEEIAPAPAEATA